MVKAVLCMELLTRSSRDRGQDLGFSYQRMRGMGGERSTTTFPFQVSFLSFFGYGRNQYMTEAGMFLARNAAMEEKRRVAIFCYFLFVCCCATTCCIMQSSQAKEPRRPACLLPRMGKKKRKIAVLSEGQAARSSEGDVESLPKRTKGRAELDFPFGIK